MQEVLKRDVVEGEKAEEARRKIARTSKIQLRKPVKEPLVKIETKKIERELAGADKVSGLAQEIPSKA